jgi:hypothetical protein
MDTTKFELADQEGLPVGGPDLEMGSMEGTVDWELQGTGASQGAAERDPPTMSLESLAERVSTLGFRKPKKTQCSAAKRRAKMSKQAGPPGGEPAGGDTRPPPGGQPHPGTDSAAGPGQGAPSPSNSKGGGQLTGLGKRQRSSGGHSGRQAG